MKVTSRTFLYLVWQRGMGRGRGGVIKNVQLLCASCFYYIPYVLRSYVVMHHFLNDLAKIINLIELYCTLELHTHTLPYIFRPNASWLLAFVHAAHSHFNLLLVLLILLNPMKTSFNSIALTTTTVHVYHF